MVAKWISRSAPGRRPLDVHGEVAVVEHRQVQPLIDVERAVVPVEHAAHGQPVHPLGMRAVVGQHLEHDVGRRVDVALGGEIDGVAGAAVDLDAVALADVLVAFAGESHGQQQQHERLRHRQDLNSTVAICQGPSGSVQTAVAAGDARARPFDLALERIDHHRLARGEAEPQARLARLRPSC